MRNARFLIHLTAEELDMLRSHVEPQGAFDHLVAREPRSGPLVSLELNAGELDDFMVLFERTANNAQNVTAMERLGHALARIESRLEGTTDPGGHLLALIGPQSGH